MTFSKIGLFVGKVRVKVGWLQQLVHPIYFLLFALIEGNPFNSICFPYALSMLEGHSQGISHNRVHFMERQSM